MRCVVNTLTDFVQNIYTDVQINM